MLARLRRTIAPLDLESTPIIRDFPRGNYGNPRITKVGAAFFFFFFFFSRPVDGTFDTRPPFRDRPFRESDPNLRIVALSTKHAAREISTSSSVHLRFFFFFFLGKAATLVPRLMKRNPRVRIICILLLGKNFPSVSPSLFFVFPGVFEEA